MTRTNLHITLFVMLVFSFVSCSKRYKIEGNSSITSLDGKMLFLKTLQDGQWVKVDSAEVVHGLFTMKGAADSVRMATLYIGDESIMPLILEDGKVNVIVSNLQLTAKGTPLNDALYNFIDRRNAMEVKLDELERKEARMVLDGADLDEVHAKLAQEGEALQKEMNEYVKGFIKDNFNNVLGPNVFMMMCNTLPYPVMTPEIEDIMRTAPLSFKEHFFVRDYLEKAKENMKLIEEYKRLQEKAN